MENAKPMVFDYTETIPYLKAVLDERKRRNPQFSLRAWTKQLGVSDAAQISRVFTQKRPITLGLAMQILEGLKLSTQEAEYFKLLALREVSTDETERSMLMEPSSFSSNNGRSPVPHPRWTKTGLGTSLRSTR